MEEAVWKIVVGDLNVNYKHPRKLRSMEIVESLESNNMRSRDSAFKAKRN